MKKVRVKGKVKVKKNGLKLGLYLSWTLSLKGEVALWPDLFLELLYSSFSPSPSSIVIISTLAPAKDSALTY